MPDNNWSEWSQYVLKELERLNNCYDKMQKDIGEIKVNIGQLQIKSGAWGAIGGILAALSIILLGTITHK